MKNACLCVVAVLAALAADAAEVKRGPWRLTIGTAWRERVKSRVTGGESVTPVAASVSSVYVGGGSSPASVPVGGWTGSEPNLTTVPNPTGTPPGSMLWAAYADRTDTVVVPNSGFGALSSSDERGTMGVKSSVGYDFYDNGTFAIGFDLKFAAYWNLKSSASGTAGGGTINVTTYREYDVFPIPFINGVSEMPLFPFSTATYATYDDATPVVPTATTVIPSTQLRGRVTSDLYQIGLGPTFTWHVCDCIDAYAKAAMLCNMISMDFNVNGDSQSTTLCKFGAGGDLGAVAWLSDNVGVYADVGYEWIDEADKRISGSRAKVDYSSLTVGAGLMVGF